uniref:Uncharacterized protein n=1 Tax=Arundo donax TaxID=35708 RepID=A0A0A8ZYW4_ARUDO
MKHSSEYPMMRWKLRRMICPREFALELFELVSLHSPDVPMVSSEASSHYIGNG